MAATNALLAFGGMTHCWRRWGLRVFFERSPDRAVAGTIDNAEFYDLVLQQPQRPARPSLRRFGTSQGDQLGLFLAVENARHRRCRALFAAQNRLEPFFHQLLAHPVDHGWAGIQGLDDPAITPTLTGLRDIGFQ